VPTQPTNNHDPNLVFKLISDSLPRLEQAMRESPALRALAADIGGWLINAAANATPDAGDAASVRAPGELARPMTTPAPGGQPSAGALGRQPPVNGPTIGQLAAPAPALITGPTHPPLPATLAATLLKRKFEPDTSQGGLTARSPTAPSDSSSPPKARQPELAPPGPAPSALAPLITRARLEAQAWAVRAKNDGAPGQPADQWSAFLKQAQALGNPLHADEAETVAGESAALFVPTYTNLAGAAEVVAHVWNDASAPAVARREAALLLAEAHSALNALSRRASEHWGNACSHVAHEWLKSAALLPEIGHLHYMRLNQPADPEAHADLAERIEVARREHSLPGTREADRDAARKRAEHHGRILRKNLKTGEKYADNDRLNEIAAVLAAGERFMELGGAVSNKEVRALVSLALGALREDEDRPPGCERVEEDIEREQAEKEENDAVELLRTKRPRSPEVNKAAELVKGRVVVLIGGDPRPSQKSLLERELAPRELRWIASRPTDAASRFETHINRKDVDLVLHVIRWTRHGHTAAVGGACRAHDKPYVRLQGGVNPSTVAHAIVEQAGERLSRKED
jgi:hypothetical protein